jgi:MFS family permease
MAPATAATAHARSAHPVVFLVLYLPYGIPGGYVIVTLAYLFSQAGLSVNQIAALVAVLYVPQTWKVAWAPIVDTTLTLRAWYLIAAAVTAVIMLLAGFVPARAQELWLLDLLVLLLSVAFSVCGMATESLMAHTTAEHQQGRAGGWSQAGSLGGQGLGGGAGLWIAQHAAPWIAGAVLAVTCLACCAALLALPAPPRVRATRHYGAQLLGVGREVWSLARSRAGFLVALLVFMPMGTAAAQNLWSPLARDWHAGAGIVALVTGVLSGVIMAVGCLAGGFVTDLINRKASYALAAVAMALCAIAMALAPRTPTSFIVFTSLYSLLGGWVYAAFTGATLETIGQGAAATKYNVLACLANIPITYMTLVDGAARTRWGPAGMLYTEALIALIAVLVFSALAVLTRPRGAAASYASQPVQS